MADIEELIERLNSTKPDQPGWWMIERDDLGYRPAYLQLRDAALWSLNWRDGFRFDTKEEAEHHLELWHSEYGHVRSHSMMTEFVNPDGPEAATALSAQQREIAELREALRPALDMCITYAGFIKDHVRADDAEVHPYLPWLEDVINDARATLAALNTPSQEGEKI